MRRPAAWPATSSAYLAGDPVEAGPPSGWYRLRKFARRNRVVADDDGPGGDIALVAGHGGEHLAGGPGGAGRAEDRGGPQGG